MPCKAAASGPPFTGSVGTPVMSAKPPLPLGTWQAHVGPAPPELHTAPDPVV
ncbi:hypothetical protein FQZ97_597350 [compost metagenome]